jgi:hypothetical protein
LQGAHHDQDHNRAHEGYHDVGDGDRGGEQLRQFDVSALNSNCPTSAPSTPTTAKYNQRPLLVLLRRTQLLPITEAAALPASKPTMIKARISDASKMISL